MSKDEAYSPECVEGATGEVPREPHPTAHKCKRAS